MKSSDDTLCSDTPLGVVGTSRDTSEKRLPTWNVTVTVGELILWIYVTLINLGPHGPRFSVVSRWFLLYPYQ